MTMFTDDQYAEWLTDPQARRVVLVKATHADGVEYFGNAAYNSMYDDADPNRHYEDLLLSDVTIEHSLSKATIGDITVVNDGSHTGWLDYDWKGYPLQIYLGDARWRFDNYRLNVDGINGGISAPSNNRHRFDVLDPYENLKQTIGSESAPIAFGECFNVRPALIDSATLRYKCNDSAVISMTIRDNGLTPGVAPTQFIATGEFTLAATPAGQITVDVVQTSKTAAQIVEAVCDLIGVPVNASNLAAFPNTAVLNKYINTATPAIEVIDSVLKTVGGSFRFNTLGEIEIFRLDVPATSTLTLTNDDIASVKNTGIKQLKTEAPVKTMTVGYAKNWSVQSADALAGSLSVSLKELYSTEYRTVEKTNTLPNNPLALDMRHDTLFVYEADAQAEADRRQVIRSVIRHLFEVKGFLASGQVVLGQTITIFYPDYSFANGLDAVVIGIERKLGKGIMNITVWR